MENKRDRSAYSFKSNTRTYGSSSDFYAIYTSLVGDQKRTKLI